jgi:hypothetical protein
MDWKFLIGAGGAVAAWLWSVWTWHKNQALVRSQNEYQRKEQLYRDMLKSTTVFYKGASVPASPPVASFLEQYRLAWLYAPDDVIQAFDSFLNTQKSDKSAEQKDQLGQKALAELVSAVRKDLFNTAKRPTELRATDFGHYS